jgi:hypothetical protein
MEARGEPSDNWYFAKGPYIEYHILEDCSQAMRLPPAMLMLRFHGLKQ